MSSANKQLELLLKIETEKQDKFAQELQSAQSYLAANQKKLRDVEGYKLEYLKKMQHMGSTGVIGGNYQHYQRFIVQLEDGIKKQLEVIEIAKEVLEQRKNTWLEQQQSVRAVELVLEKKRHKQQQVIERGEQQAIDEFATQKYIRSRLAQQKSH
ncbi:MAG: flagellar export protein FliJ [Gammaproteobacteria bacterium]|nr:flagellar export protein FliJ [Gammaproteobacteria bacterium]